MIKRILVATDGSPSADAALSIAVSLGGITGVEVVGVFVEDIARLSGLSTLQAVGRALTGEPLLPQPLAPEQLAAVEQTLGEEVSGLQRIFTERCANANVAGRFVSVRGEPEILLREWAKTVDFVVLGNSGRHPDRPASGTSSAGHIPGGTVLSLLRTVARPILVVPDEVAGESIIVVAYDGNLTADRALRAAAEFAEIADFETIHLLTVASDLDLAQAIQAPALQYLAAYQVAVTPVCLIGKPQEVISHYVSEVDASILALGAFGSNRIKEAIFGSTTETVLRDSEAAVLLVS